MKRLVASGAAALLLLLAPHLPADAAEAPPAAPESAPQATESPYGVAGIWISPQVTQAGILMVLQMSPDEKVRASLRARSAVNYQVLSSEAPTFRLAYSSGDDTVEQTLEAEGDDLVIRQPNQEVAREMKRVAGSPTGEHAFVGRWSSQQPGTGDIAVVEYTADGKLLFDLPVRTIFGTYTVAGDLITIDWAAEMPNQDVVNLRWDGEELYGTDAEGEEHLAFRRLAHVVPKEP